MRGSSTAVAVACAGAVALAGCGSFNPNGPAPPSRDIGATGSVKQVHGVANSVRNQEIGITAHGLRPRAISLRAGIIVHWFNRDKRPYTVRSVPGSRQKFDRRIPPGQGFTITAVARGRIRYTVKGGGKRYNGRIDVY